MNLQYLYGHQNFTYKQLQSSKCLRGESFLCHVFSVKSVQNLRTFWRTTQNLLILALLCSLYSKHIFEVWDGMEWNGMESDFFFSKKEIKVYTQKSIFNKVYTDTTVYYYPYGYLIVGSDLQVMK